MKSELRAGPHTVVAGALVVEVWHDGDMVAAVYTADGPGVRVVSKYPLIADVDHVEPNAITVRVAR